ncbi:MAG: NAD(P)H-binding protein [Oligoflexia bacterium]|nr:NAD(P)H-binding protein [Oligoflexia bacterium]
MKKNLKVLVLGGTGLVGNELINLMLKDETISSITSLVRSPKGINHPKLNEEIIDFEEFENIAHYFEKKDIVFCCLGTTIKKVKGDKMLFRKVDLEYPVKACKTALEKKVKHFIMISSLGADSNSPFFYNQVKGECENRVKAIGGGKGFNS